jgi:hypothetical protein
MSLRLVLSYFFPGIFEFWRRIYYFYYYWFFIEIKSFFTWTIPSWFRSFSYSFRWGFLRKIINFFRNSLKFLFSIAIPLIILSFLLFLSRCYKKIAIKTNQENPDIAFIPFFGPLIVAFVASKMSWKWILTLYIPLLAFLIDTWFFKKAVMEVIVSLIFVVFGISIVLIFIISHYRMFRAVEKPGMWAIIPFIIGAISLGVLYLGYSMNWFSSILSFILISSPFLIIYTIFLYLASRGEVLNMGDLSKK